MTHNNSWSPTVVNLQRRQEASREVAFTASLQPTSKQITSLSRRMISWRRSSKIRGSWSICNMIVSWNTWRKSRVWRQRLKDSKKRTQIFKQTMYSFQNCTTSLRRSWRSEVTAFCPPNWPLQLKGGQLGPKKLVIRALQGVIDQDRGSISHSNTIRPLAYFLSSVFNILLINALKWLVV